MRLSKERKVVLAMLVLVYAAMFVADVWRAAALVCIVTALVLNVWLMLQHMQITIGRWTIGKIR